LEKEMAHKLIMTDRSFLELEGVNQVDSFDEKEIILETKLGVLFLKGEDLHITQLHLENGNLIVEGFINSIEYSEDKGVKNFRHKGKGILEKIFK